MLSEEATAAEGSEAQGEPQNEQKVDTIWVGEGLGLRVGDRARLLIQDQEADYTVGGLLQGQSNEAIVMDLAMATEALRRNGGLDRILVKTSSDTKALCEPHSRRA